MLCEEIVPLACSGPVEGPVWLAAADGERLLAARPARNLLPTAIEQQLGILLPALPALQAGLEAIAAERADAQRTAHERVRAASGIGRSRARSGTAVEPVLPADILAAYVLLPVLN